jgi:cytochrome c2
MALAISGLLAGFELVKFTDLFANSIPPADSSEQIQTGFLSTREFCMNCHKVNGDGGKKAPDLIQAGLVANNTNARIKELITNINVAPVSGMVLRDELPNRDQVADDIIAYLKAMETKK